MIKYFILIPLVISIGACAGSLNVAKEYGSLARNVICDPELANSVINVAEGIR